MYCICVYEITIQTCLKWHEIGFVDGYNASNNAWTSIGTP